MEKPLLKKHPTDEDSIITNLKTEVVESDTEALTSFGTAMEMEASEEDAELKKPVFVAIKEEPKDENFLDEAAEEENVEATAYVWEDADPSTNPNCTNRLEEPSTSSGTLKTVKKFIPCKSVVARKHLCTECGKTFSTSSNLKAHFRSHSEERPFHCSVCNKGFKSNRNLKLHLSTHAGEKPFHCEECGASFCRQSYLKTHLIIHSGVKKHNCTICGSSFARSTDLQYHVRIHTKERPYHCSECGRSFVQSSALHAHKRTHSGEKRFSCDECGKLFMRRGHLASHMQRMH